MEVMEASTSTDSLNFHVLPWKLPLTSMEVIRLPPSMAIAIVVNIYSSTDHGSKLSSMDVN